MTEVDIAISPDDVSFEQFIDNRADEIVEDSRWELPHSYSNSDGDMMFVPGYFCTQPEDIDAVLQQLNAAVENFNAMGIF